MTKKEVCRENPVINVEGAGGAADPDDYSASEGSAFRVSGFLLLLTNLDVRVRGLHLQFRVREFLWGFSQQDHYGLTRERVLEKGS